MTREYALRTVAAPSSWSGLGLHSGVPATVRLTAGANGIRFLLGSETVQAAAGNVSSTARCTQLGPISTIEHLMAALAALEITDADIEVSAPELPALDGSSKPYFDALLAAGCREIGKLKVSGPFARVYVKSDIAKVAIGEGDGKWRYRLECEGRWPNEQEFEADLSAEIFGSQIGPARTWSFSEQVEQILAAGLAKGLDKGSALIVGPGGYENEPRFADEPARHKLLDLIGDLYLSGVPIKHLNVTALRGGHALHVRAAKLLSESVTLERVI